MSLKFLCLVAIFFVSLPTKAETDVTTAILNRFVDAKDYMGLRVYLRKLSKTKRLDEREWIDTRSFIINNVSKTGYDILYSWDKLSPRGLESRRVAAIRKYLSTADALMLEKNFNDAFETYQKVAQSLKADIDGKDKTMSESASILYPYVLEGMARSLYGIGRFAESTEVFGWIPISYPRYRRALFESMWASFQAGRADDALGRIASQFSSFFTEFHYPESYLMRAYIYKKLCRNDELSLVIKKMKTLREEVKSGRFTWKDWARTDIEGFVFGKILEAQPKNLVDLVSEDERNLERRSIERALKGAFKTEKELWLNSMETAIAYARLSTGASSQLKPIRHLPSREALFKAKLEIWPAQDKEEWIDEIGTHRFVGESKCASR